MTKLVLTNAVYEPERSQTGAFEVKALAGGGVRVDIPDKVVPNDTLHVYSYAGTEGAAFRPRIEVHAGASTRLRLIVEHIGLVARYQRNIETEIFLKPGACVNFVDVYKPGARARGTSLNRYHLGQHADLEVFTYVVGGAEGDLWIDNKADLNEPHAFATFRGLGVLDDDVQVHFATTVRHASTHGTSRQVYKNILSGRAQTELDSLVDVEPGASKSDSNQLAKSLLLSDHARAQARPLLRIRHDDVSCAHGAAVGRLEKDELFYLTSRGLDKNTARLILTYGFAEEMLASLEPALRAEFSSAVRERLSKMLGPQRLAA